ncbi:DNA topoisomerase 3-alpha [Dictyocoela muelleri]|nr:DNA topoisomerase 3-alpha [Dictyocoela muelleri]
MKILNIAEKPSVARTISTLLSQTKQTSNTKNKYIKNITFPFKFNNEDVLMTFTSVLGHLKTLEYERQSKWTEICPFDLFSDPVRKSVTDKTVMENIHRQVRAADMLIIWTDCDREGENIAIEIKDVAWEVKPITVRRARFAGISRDDILSALDGLTDINEYESKAVDTRMELDLRIGSSITRLQTLLLGLPKMVISYGSCQIPTLGFVVHRHQQIKNFFPENFYTLEISIFKKIENKFCWKRGNVFDKNCVISFYESLALNKNKLAQIGRVTKTEKIKYRPLPLRTVELQKIMSKCLKIDSNKIMETSESLYNKGYISYPRTETDTFPKNFSYKKILDELNCNPEYSEFAEKLINKFQWPRNGKNNDQAHLPIYPIKSGTGLSGLERSIYDFVARRFMACISKDAKADEMNVELIFNDEKFILSGLKIKEKNYLDVYPFDRWENKSIDDFKEGERFLLNSKSDNHSNNHKPETNKNIVLIDKSSKFEESINKFPKNNDFPLFNLKMAEGKTSPPVHLSESELISLMDKNGIGTDATIHEHIAKIQKRRYAIKKQNKLFPTDLGEALILGYEKIGLQISYPDLRRKLETDLKSVCINEKNPEELLNEEIEVYKNVYRTIEGGINIIKSIYEDLSSKKPDYDKKDYRKAISNEIDHKKDFNQNREVKKIRNLNTRFNQNVLIREDENKNDVENKNEEEIDSIIKIVKTNKKLENKVVNQWDLNDKKVDIKCHCNKLCKKGVVSKKGQNKGKIFFSCANWPNGCDFFQWEDCPREVSVFENEDYKCFCGYFPEMKISNTEKNKGRKFLKCKKVYKPCKYFKWLDE